jgi:ribonuclease-3
MRPADEEFLDNLRSVLDVSIKGNEEWFLKAFTHRSYANETSLDYDNERLEFLGDTALDLCVAEYLFREFPDDREGRLSKIKSAVVRADSLSRMARKLDLAELIRLSKGESKVERGRDKVIADTFEAFVGALYMSSGLEEVRQFLLPYVREETRRYLEEGGRNYKGQLLEFTQERNLPNPVYRVETVNGPEHDPIHCVIVSIDDTDYGRGQGSTKKEAEQQAAQEALGAVRDEFD